MPRHCFLPVQWLFWMGWVGQRVKVELLPCLSGERFGRSSLVHMLQWGNCGPRDKLAISGHSPMTWQLGAAFPHCQELPLPFALTGICARSLGANVCSLCLVVILAIGHSVFNWFLCWWTGNPIGTGHQAQASGLTPYSISLWSQKTGVSSCCVSLLKRMNYSSEKQMLCLFLTCSFCVQYFVASFWWPVNQGGSTWSWYFFSGVQKAHEIIWCTQVSGIRVPLPHCLKSGIHISVISATHYWDVCYFTSAQFYRAACADIHYWHTVFATKERSAVMKLLPLSFNGLYPHEARRNRAVHWFVYFVCVHICFYINLCIYIYI